MSICTVSPGACHPTQKRNSCFEIAVHNLAPASMSSFEATQLWQWGYLVTTAIPPALAPTPDIFMLDASVPPSSMTSGCHAIRSHSQHSSMAATTSSSQEYRRIRVFDRNALSHGIAAFQIAGIIVGRCDVHRNADIGTNPLCRRLRTSASHFFLHGKHIINIVWIRAVILLQRLQKLVAARSGHPGIWNTPDCSADPRILRNSRRRSRL